MQRNYLNIYLICINVYRMPEVWIKVKEIVLSKTITGYRKNFIWNVKILADIFQCFFM